MRITILSLVALWTGFLPGIVNAGVIDYHNDSHNEAIEVCPSAGATSFLNQITVSTVDSKEFGAFVYMPSLYSVNANGSIGDEVSSCELLDSTARGKKTLQFRLKNPPATSGKYALKIKPNSFSLKTYNKDVAATDDQYHGQKGDYRISAPYFSNFPINLGSDTLRILHISNSYGGNLLYYINELIKEAKVDDSKVLVERLLYTGGSFKDWVAVDKDKNPKNYWFYKMAGNLDTTLKNGEGEKNDGSKFRTILEEHAWDLILINQASQYAPFFYNWESTDYGGFLHEFLGVIRKHQPETPVGVLLIHSYAEEYEGNTQHWTTKERWERNRDGVEWLNYAYGIDFVVPYGTAIENLRLTEYNNDYDLTGDGTHLSGGLAQYTAGCCYFESVFSPRYKVSVWDNPLRLPNPSVQYSDKFDNCVIPVDDAAAEIAQKAAFLATHNMFEIRNPYLCELDDYVYGEELNQKEYCFIYDLSTQESVFEIAGHPIATPYCIYGATGIPLRQIFNEEDWMRLPKGLYILNGKKIYKNK